MSKFSWPKVVIVEVEGDTEFVTNGLGTYPGVEWDEDISSTVVHWHEGHERVSVVDFLLENSPERYQWKAGHRGVFTLRPMTIADWKSTFVPKGWRDFEELDELQKFVCSAMW